jgi:LacI family transcriptional regulator
LGRFLEGLEKPSAILCANDSVAAIVIKVALARGLSVPGDLAVLGVDDDELSCELAPISISSIDPDQALTGAEAASHLLKLLAHPQAKATEIMVLPRGIVERESTRHVAFRDPLVCRFVRVLDANPSKPYSVKVLADELGVSRRTLERRFLAARGYLPLEEVQRRRLRRAVRLIRDTDRTIQDIAANCGYGDARGLYGDIQAHHGTTPLLLRHRLRARCAN